MSVENVEKIPFEVAVDQAGFGLFNYQQTALTGLVIISFACINYATSIIVPTSACELATTGAQQGILASTPLIGSIVGAILWGYLGDTRGRRNMLLLSLLAAALVNAVASLSVNWIMLMLLQLIAAILASGQYTLSMTLLSECAPLSKRNYVVLLVSSIFLLSQGIMAALAIPIIPLTFSIYLETLGIYWNSWRTLMLVYCCPSIISGCWLYFLPESPKFLLLKGEEKQALAVLNTIHRWNKGKAAGDLGIQSLLREDSSKATKLAAKDQLFPLFRRPLLKYTLIMAALQILKQANAFIVWLPTIANQYINLLETGEGMNQTLCSILRSSLDIVVEEDAVPCALNVTSLVVVLSVGVLSSIVNFIMSLLVDRAGRRNTTIVITAVFGLAGILTNLVPNAIGSGVLFTTFLMSVIVLGLYTAMTMALFPTHLRAMAISITLTGSRIATIAYVQILNYMLVNSCEAGFYIFSALFTSSAIIASFLPDDRILLKRAKELPTPKPKDIEVEEDYDLKTSL